MTHPCDTCGGRGWHVFCDEHGCTEDCPVCRGAGSLPDRMPVADALADAETLLAAYEGNSLVHPIRHVWAIVRHGSKALDLCRGYTSPRLHEEAARQAVLAARAAFRAVPGLREK